MILQLTEKISFEEDGKFRTFLKIPHSSNTSGWGSLLLPIIVIKNGEGPTILFTGGNHGDEYEGPIALRKLANTLKPEDIQGQLIIVPYLNYPAVLAGTRLSPVDGLNMNRAFPGNPQGTMTSLIADYVFRELVLRSDVVLDFHSGGNSMIFEPCVVMHELENQEQMSKTIAAAHQFGAPISLVLRELDSDGMLDTVTENAGKIFLSTELGGGGFVSPRTLRIAENGIKNILRHFSILAPSKETVPETRFMETPDIGGYIMASSEGLFEPLVELGGSVSEGQVIGMIHSLTDIDVSPVEIHSQTDGILITRAGRAHVKNWDTIAVIAADLDISKFEI
ncbi:MAG: succinylglutamate desuccinylase/aspartoacylase family protein [SAR324 cluster bacterium]|nr:succinylglutamate desuccinylase/aspartoacylase family protein [SAR324 cluster bacterium]MBL7034118.1 succinylglutamate desuccinylase/aspartoacylase family protein [SAR324 cluster bacterium]